MTINGIPVLTIVGLLGLWAGLFFHLRFLYYFKSDCEDVEWLVSASIFPAIVGAVLVTLFAID